MQHFFEAGTCQRLSLKASAFSFHCIHGFLGLPRDWDYFFPKGEKAGEGDRYCYSLWDIAQEIFRSEDAKGEVATASGKKCITSFGPPVVTYENRSADDSFLWNAARSINQSVKQEMEHSASDLPARGSQKRVLLGYSLGGRIGLHALLDTPHLWNAAIIISAHPGMETSRDALMISPREAFSAPVGEDAEIFENFKEGNPENGARPTPSTEERKVRGESDHRWARRFLTEPWEQLSKSWNEQKVFSLPALQSESQAQVTPLVLDRKEADFSREHLARVLVEGSLAVQKDLRPLLQELEIPILWIFGEHDVKYSELAHQMVKRNPLFQCRAIRGASHRAPWDQPRLFMEVVSAFLTDQFSTKG